MDQSYLARIRAQVVEELSRSASSDQAAHEQPAVMSFYGPYYEAAAVLSTFDSKRLKPVGAGTNEESVDDVLADSVLFKDVQRNSCWGLLPEVRQDVLRQLGTREAMQRALAANPERSSDPLQHMLEAYIRGDAPEVERQSTVLIRTLAHFSL
jgi:hypothetical protein